MDGSKVETYHFDVTPASDSGVFVGREEQEQEGGGIGEFKCFYSPNKEKRKEKLI
jgi:hypothetical protein